MMNIKRCLLFLCIFLIIFCVIFDAYARQRQILNTRTQLRPVNWPSHQKLWFAPGEIWIDEFEKGVQSGTLDQTANLKIWNSKQTVEFGPGFIRFERGGGVKEGTLLRDTDLCVVNTASSHKQILKFMGKKRVEFGYDGCVMRGTLAQQATLKTWDNKVNTYPPGTTVDFNGAGLVTRAQLPPRTSTNIDGTYTGTLNLSGETYQFNFKAYNGRFSGGVDQRNYSLRWQGNYDSNGKISNGIITGFVDIMEGGRKIRWTVRGPVTGILAPNGSRGNASATTSDGRITRSGPWTATRIGP